MATVQEQVFRLEDDIRAFVHNVGVEFNKLYNLQTQLSMEMKEFKEEMRQFKDRTIALEEKIERDIAEGRRENREMNRRWGEISNKLGTLVEDLVYPSLARIVREALGLEVIDLTVRHKRRLPDGRNREFDAIATTEDPVVLNSTKSTLRSADVDRFVDEIGELRVFFPEFRGRPVVGVLASVSVEPSVLTYAEKTGFLVIATGDELMEIKNAEGFEAKRW